MSRDLRIFFEQWYVAKSNSRSHEHGNHHRYTCKSSKQSYNNNISNCIQRMVCPFTHNKIFCDLLMIYGYNGTTARQSPCAFVMVFNFYYTKMEFSFLITAFLVINAFSPGPSLRLAYWLNIFGMQNGTKRHTRLAESPSHCNCVLITL